MSRPRKASPHSRMAQHQYGSHDEQPHPDCPLCEIAQLEGRLAKTGLGTASMGRLTDLRTKHRFYLPRP